MIIVSFIVIMIFIQCFTYNIMQRGDNRINLYLPRVSSLASFSVTPREAYCRTALNQMRVEFIIDVY